MKAKLYLIPTTLGVSPVNSVIPEDVKKKIIELKYFIVENLRSARRYLKLVEKSINIDELTFFELNKHTKKGEIYSFLDPIENGNDIGILSEAGNPGIADPGSDIVKIAHQKRIRVIPLVGPSSILLALISSGMNGQNFAFNGYLPVQKGDKRKKLLYLENKSKSENQTQIFMETPFRNMGMLEDIIQTCNKNTMLCVAADITLETEFIKTKSIAEWKKGLPPINKRPAIFIIQA